MRLIGIGIDIVEVNKIKKAIKKFGVNFLKRVFDKKELQNISKNRVYYQRLAARFAAKEAVIKALSKKETLALNEILILNKPNGAPYCEFKKDINVEVFLSITHIEKYAVACAIASLKD